MENSNKCVICNETITPDEHGWDGGCNADPIANGQCCKKCDDTIVLPARLVLFGYKPKGD